LGSIISIANEMGAGGAADAAVVLSDDLRGT
jgi:hypothetical protein